MSCTGITKRARKTDLATAIASWITKMVQFRQCFDAADRLQVKVPTFVAPTIIGKFMSIGTCFAVHWGS